MFRSTGGFLKSGWSKVISWARKDTWLLPYLKTHRNLLLLTLLLGFLTYAAAAGLMFSSGYLISKAAAQPYNIMLIYVPIVLTRAFGIARPTLRYAERLVGHNFVLRLTSDLRVRLYRTLEPQARRLKNTYKTGDILSILVDDIEHIQNLYLRTVFPVFIALLVYLAAVIILGVFSWTFALLMLLWLAIMLILLPLVTVAVDGARSYARKERRNHLYQSLTDAVLGAGDWLFSGRKRDFIEQYEAREDALRDLQVRRDRFARCRDFIWQVLAGGVVVAMLLWTGSLVSRGDLQANWLAAFVLALFPLLDAFAPVPEAVGNLPGYESSWQRMNLLVPPTGAQPQPVDLPKKPVTVCLREVYFYYDKERPVLQGLNLCIPPGQKIAVLGPSGAGKSTLTALIRGDLAPVQGKVLLNEIPSASLGDRVTSLISVLNQHPYLFDTTIRNNLRLGDPQVSDEEIDAAIVQAGLQPLIATLPQGADSPVEEAGARFSGGERQRMALARILLQKTPIVILDEPAVGLDPRSEAALLAAVLESLADKTVIWITHNLRKVESLDKIIFLERGRILMAGNHAQLFESSDRYRMLYALDH